MKKNKKYFSDTVLLEFCTFVLEFLFIFFFLMQNMKYKTSEDENYK